MKSYIGGRNIMAWVARVLSPSPQVMRAEKLEKFRESFCLSSESGEAVSATAVSQKGDSLSQGMGLISREITHVSRQAYPYRRLQRAIEREDSRIEDNVLPGSQTQMVLRALRQRPSSDVARQPREAETSTNVQRPATRSNGIGQSTQINRKEVADRVYRLMQYDLIIERERATKVGG